MVLVATIISYLLHSWFLFVFYYHFVCFVIAMRSKWHKTQLCLGQNSEFMAMMLMSMTKKMTTKCPRSLFYSLSTRASFAHVPRDPTPTEKNVL